MDDASMLNYDSASYRLVGVVSIGITKIPIVSFGYPEFLTFDEDFHSRMVNHFKNHKYAAVEIETIDSITDRVTWSILDRDPSSKGNHSESEVQFYLYLDLPMESRIKPIGTHLFAETACQENGFLVAITAEDKTYLNFYNLKMVQHDPVTKRITGVIGYQSKYVEGPAVPLLRTIETLKSQIAPQRKIEISDEELGIIYLTLSGSLE
jgi:hypothetical protein